MPTDTFPIDLSSFQRVALDPAVSTLTDDQHAALRHNVQLCRDAIVLFTTCGGASGYGGHSGGPFDTVPEVCVALGFIEHHKQTGKHAVCPILWDEAAHRVATQYLLAALNGDLEPAHLLNYRAFESRLPGHPERGFTAGVHFSSGRLGHMWPYVNGYAMAHPDEAVFLLGSDGSQQEGNDAEAARLAVAQGLNVKLLVDDNDVTIAGHPSDYMPGFSTEQTLAGHGVPTSTGDGEDLATLYTRMAHAVVTPGPVALINQRKMAPGVPGVEGTPHGHDVFKVEHAVAYFEQRGGMQPCIDILQSRPKAPKKPAIQGVSDDVVANRGQFGKVFNEVLAELSPEERLRTVRVFDCDLEGSTGIEAIREAYPELYVKAGIMERGNYSAAAGFGYDEDKQGVFATFSAFLEMVVSEITMARLNFSNVLAHFSHAGVDDMADNTCHFGINNLFCDGGIDTDHQVDNTRAYFPGDPNQFRACVKRVFRDKGLRFVFSNRSKIPFILKEDGTKFYADDAAFEPGKDDVIREGTAGYVVSFGSTLHRALGAVTNLRKGGLDVGLICKATLNTIDESTMQRIADTGFCLVAEEFNVKTGLGVRFGNELMKRGYAGRYNHIGVTKEGSGGLWQQMGHQGLDVAGITATIQTMAE